MTYTQALRDFWSVATLEQAKHERVTVPAQPGVWSDEVQAQITDRVLGDVSLAPGAVILDYGCGVGRIARQVARRGCRVIAADVSEQMLVYCREHCAGLTNIEYVLSDGYGVSALADASLDGAYSFFVFQHMPCRDMASKVLADLHRVLKPGGWCKVQTLDARVDNSVAEVGFVGARQSPCFLLETARQIGFQRIHLSVDVNHDHDNLVLTVSK